ncbi:MAG: sodium:calcium antiporter [Oscillospiraceae bacterium]|nr:sodium:calcium antiporter [Oscillospiraceae bacterium]
MLLHIVLSILGFILLIKCADFFVSGASSLAKNLKVPTAIIGLTILAFGTSAPELAISFSSHLTDNTDMLLGTVIGSNIINILLILGLAILIKPLNINKDVIKKELPILLFITLGFSILFLDTVFSNSITNGISVTDGIILLLFFAVFVYYLISVSYKHRKEKQVVAEKPKYRLPISIGITLLGLIGIIVGSELVVLNISSIAESIGISQKIIGLTIIALRNSSPRINDYNLCCEKR